VDHERNVSLISSKDISAVCQRHTPLDQQLAQEKLTNKSMLSRLINQKAAYCNAADCHLEFIMRIKWGPASKRHANLLQPPASFMPFQKPTAFSHMFLLIIGY
jgi:hypothetical protein